MPNKPTSENHGFLGPLINTIKELSGIISEEMILLKTSRPKELEKLLPLKNQLMATYHKEMTELSSRGGLQASGSGSAVRILKKESRIFLSVLTRHTRRVKALKKISEGMIKAISDEVIRNQNQTSRYGADGARSANRLPTSITLNQTI
ncbi:MAG: hypothetical protein COB49_11145 [Alphaproteobacteria bacterium]|nr:MAG: hypothetical protein COB49_11145 [Alphaproteobacteria bacterium]